MSTAHMFQIGGGGKPTNYKLGPDQLWMELCHPFQWPKINGFHCFVFHPKKWSYDI